MERRPEVIELQLGNVEKVPTTREERLSNAGIIPSSGKTVELLPPVRTRHPVVAFFLRLQAIFHR